MKTGRTDKEMAELREQVREMFAQVLETSPEAISDTAHFIDDLGGDSLQSISLSIRLEEKFDLLIPTAAFMSCVCVNDVARLLYDLRHGTSREEADEEEAPVKMITRFEDTPEHASFQKRLRGIEAAGENPYFVCHESPLAAASLEAIRLLKTRPEILADLRRNIRVFVEEAHKRNLNTCLAGETAIIPILVGGDDEAFALSVEMGKHGVFVPPAVYPAVPRGKSRLRYCVTSNHKPEQIVKAMDLLVETAKRMGIALPAMSAG